MKAKQFKEVNAVYGENQPEYYPLPAYKDSGNRGTLGSPSNI